VNARAIRGWLLKSPRPVTLKLTCGENVTAITREPTQTWADVAESVEALEPDLIEAFDAKASLIRAIRTDNLSEAPADDDTASSGKTTDTRKAYDAETERMKVFAQLLAEAYKFATGTAFDRMIGLFDGVARQSEAQTKTLYEFQKLLGKAYQDQVDMALENAGNEKEPDMLTSLVGALVQGASQGAAERIAKSTAITKSGIKPPTNGKAS
jgi:hypothetical protein